MESESKLMYKVGTKTIYEKNDLVGPYSILFIEEVETRKRHRYGRFLCPKCKKNIFKAKISSVKSGYSKQCNECRAKRNLEHCKEMQQNRVIDLSGVKFGKLTALYPTEKRSADSSVIWVCKCSCQAETIVEVSSNHLRTGHTKSCGCMVSKGEEKVATVLSKQNIRFIKQKTFENLKSNNNKHLYFDFYLPDYNCCIEYDGEQHYGVNYRGWFTKEEQQKIQERDKIKNQYCKNHNLKLIRIPYSDYKYINEQYLLTKILEE